MGPCFVSEYMDVCLCASVCLGLSGFECLPLNLRVLCVWVTFLKGIGGGVGCNFAFPMVEINQSWESKLLAVKTPGGGVWRKEGRRTKVKREDEWLQGKRNINPVQPRAVPIKLQRKA